MDEFGLIDRFVGQFEVFAAPRGPGDDCAVLPAQGPSCITTDALVEGVHFTRAFPLEDIGHKALAVNLSDLAAMGARPTWFTVALGLPDAFTAAQLKKLGKGMSALARTHGAKLVGGNITRAQQLSVTVTILGALDGPPLLRSGAKAGDALYVSGPLGDAAAGLEGKNELMKAQRRPTPHLAFGQLARKKCSAGIDVSDGLAQDLAHLCRASRVGADLDSRAIPLSRALVRFAGSREAALRYALTGGEDYVLLVAVRRPGPFEAAMASAGFFADRIGRLTEGDAVKLDGVPMKGQLGFKHR